MKKRKVLKENSNISNIKKKKPKKNKLTIEYFKNLPSLVQYKKNQKKEYDEIIKRNRLNTRMKKVKKREIEADLIFSKAWNRSKNTFSSQNEEYTLEMHMELQAERDSLTHYNMSNEIETIPGGNGNNLQGLTSQLQLFNSLSTFDLNKPNQNKGLDARIAKQMERNKALSMMKNEVPIMLNERKKKRNKNKHPTIFNNTKKKNEYRHQTLIEKAVSEMNNITEPFSDSPKNESYVDETKLFKPFIG